MKSYLLLFFISIFIFISLFQHSIAADDIIKITEIINLDNTIKISIYSNCNSIFKCPIYILRDYQDLCKTQDGYYNILKSHNIEYLFESRRMIYGYGYRYTIIIYFCMTDLNICHKTLSEWIDSKNVIEYHHLGYSSGGSFLIKRANHNILDLSDMPKLN